MANRKTLIGTIVATLLGIGLVVSITTIAYSPRCTSYEHHGIKYCSQLVWGGSNNWTEPLEK